MVWSQVFSTQVLITSFLEKQSVNVSNFFAFRMLGSGTHGDPQQKQRIFQLNSVTSDPVILGSILDVVWTVSPWRFISLVILSQIVSYNYPLREICRNRVFFSPFPHIRTESYLYLLLFGKNPILSKYEKIRFCPYTGKYGSEKARIWTSGAVISCSIS